MSVTGIAGYHSLFNHDEGINYAADTALHAALDEVLTELVLDPETIEENKGEVTPATMAEELREQLQHFTQIGDRFAEELTEEFESKLRAYEEDLESEK